jgi:CDP-glycerol glycerophosphotransferase
VALVSVVIPVHGVAEFLPECLDSILFQTFTDISVTVVDDASPDASAAIALDYARRDRRVRVVRLDRNVGLGRARAAGFHHSDGEYVWFVDGDDRLDPDALATVAARLAEVEPDLLLVDYRRDSWTPAESHSRLEVGLPAATTPAVFTAAGRPDVFALLHTAWARVARRDLVHRAGLPFHPGWYEDVSFTYPLLVAARRISALHQVCYRYRDGRPGAITATPGPGHFAVFDQYDRLFATLRRWGVDPADPVWAAIFERMLWHYRWILNASSRVPVELERAFFARMSQHYLRYLPAGAGPRPGFESLKRTLIARGSWRVFAALRLAQRLARLTPPQ